MIILREFLGGQQELDLSKELGYKDFILYTGVIDVLFAVIDWFDIEEDSYEDHSYYLNSDEPEYIERYTILEIEFPLNIFGLENENTNSELIL